MRVPLVQQIPEVRGQVSGQCFHLIWVHFIGVQPLQVQDVLLTVSELINMMGCCQACNVARIL